MIEGRGDLVLTGDGEELAAEPDDRPALEIYRTPPLSRSREARVTDLMIPLTSPFMNSLTKA